MLYSIVAPVYSLLCIRPELQTRRSIGTQEKTLLSVYVQLTCSSSHHPPTVPAGFHRSTTKDLEETSGPGETLLALTSLHGRPANCNGNPWAIPTPWPKPIAEYPDLTGKRSIKLSV